MLATLYPLLEEVAGAFASALSALRHQRADPPLIPPVLLQLRAGAAESPGWLLVQACEFAPEPLTVDLFRRRDVYGAPRLIQALFDIMLTEQWFDEADPQGYVLSQTGQALVERSNSRRAALLHELSAYLRVDIQHLVDILQRVIVASIDDAKLPSTWCIAHSRNRAPTPEAAPILHLFHDMDDFNALRDDAHMAAWQPLQLDGAAWEAFAFVCAGQATSAAECMPELARRGYTQREYAAFLASVASRGWLQESTRGYEVTELGRTVRLHAEHQTDAYFSLPWRSALTSAEYTTAALLLTQLRDELLSVEQQLRA